MQKTFARFGITSTFVRATDTAAIRSALRPETRLIYVETPANPTLDLVDLEAAVEVARFAGIPLVVDNTFAGPHLQRPLAMGAGLVVHSMTKSLNGHSDVIAGMIVARQTSMLESVRHTAISVGTTMDPHQAWLVLRGIRTGAAGRRHHSRLRPALRRLRRPRRYPRRPRAGAGRGGGRDARPTEGWRLAGRPVNTTLGAR